ncbi:MAG: hypothetical protein PSV16_14700 [Flavobacterium sp.]|nr:hypothetical protein [Flavobacterium sp.]
MIYSQTFATDLLEKLSPEKIDEMLALQYLSAVSIKKQMSRGDKFYLITDTKGKEYTQNFPYDEILTSLDDYPYIRPVKMSIYKLYSIEVFIGKTYVHFDNDVLLFRKIPPFEDTIVQNCEGNSLRANYFNKIRHYEWVFPEYIDDIRQNYNPGVFGFTKDSKVRDLYYSTALEYSARNIEILNNMQSSTRKSIHSTAMNDVCLVLEEGLLWYLCNRDKINVVEFAPDRLADYPLAWGTYSRGKIRNIDFQTIGRKWYFNWRHEKYLHLMGYMYMKDNHELSFLPQRGFLEMYYLYPEEVNKLLKGNLWKQ